MTWFSRKFDGGMSHKTATEGLFSHLQVTWHGVCMCGYRRSLKYFWVLQFNKKITLVILDSKSRERLEWFNSLSHDIALWKRYAVVYYQHFKKYHLSLAQNLAYVCPVAALQQITPSAAKSQQLLPQPTTIALQARINFTLSPWESALIEKSFLRVLSAFFIVHFLVPPSPQLMKFSVAHCVFWAEAYPSLGDRL